MFQHERPTYDELERALMQRDKRIRELEQRIKELEDERESNP